MHIVAYCRVQYNIDNQRYTASTSISESVYQCVISMECACLHIIVYALQSTVHISLPSLNKSIYQEEILWFQFVTWSVLGFAETH